MDHMLVQKKTGKEFNMKKNYTIKNILVQGIGGRVKRFGFKVYESFFPKFKIDEGLIYNIIKDFNLDNTTNQLREGYKNFSLQKNDNSEYFNNFLTYNSANKHLPDNPLFLYPPNVAVMDFFYKNFNKDVIALDYGFGLGNLQVYLRKIGFINTFGHDNYSQISLETIQNYLNNFGSSDMVLSKDKALALKTKVVTCICYFWSRLEKDLIKKELENSDLEYILLDYHYAPRYIKNFRIVGVYDNLLIVFKRKK
jgi:hypothetical protein